MNKKVLIVGSITVLIAIMLCFSWFIFKSKKQAAILDAPIYKDSSTANPEETKRIEHLLYSDQAKVSTTTINSKLYSE